MKDAMSSPIGAIAPGAEDPRVSVTNGDALDGSRPQFSYTDLREWVTQADRLGEIRIVPGDRASIRAIVVGRHLVRVIGFIAQYAVSVGNARRNEQRARSLLAQMKRVDPAE